MQSESIYLVSDLFDGTLPAGIEAPGQQLPVTPMVHPKLQELLLAGSSGCGFCLTCTPALTSCTPGLTSCTPALKSCTPALNSCTQLWHEVSSLYQALVIKCPKFPLIKDKYHTLVEILEPVQCHPSLPKTLQA